MDYIPNHLPEIDIIEIVNLSSVQRPDRVDQYMQEAISAKRIEVTDEIAQQIAELWRNLPPSEQMRCHNPPFGLRFF